MALARVVSMFGGRVVVTLSLKLRIVIESAPHEANDMSDVRNGGWHYRWLSRFRHFGIPEGRAKGVA